ncbi:MAG: GNAT family N-acetyltransferase [Alphaproteobacteria bacterium]|nr:GNAT family N-acetyltransferase [Alphaproteobacteria bacterium]
MGAEPTPAMARVRLDFDQFDAICDHMLVIDHSCAADDAVIGTYRLLRGDVAAQSGIGFYSAGEYDISRMVARLGDHKACETGRSCVHREHRNNATIQFLWRGLARYFLDHEITRIFGCASFPGTHVESFALPLSYLYHHHLGAEDTRVRALDSLYQRMDWIAKDQIDARAAIKAVPPLIRAYLRLGGRCGDGAVIDRQFRTTDVFMVLFMEDVPERYHEFYEREVVAAS